jgi:ProQ/FINO family
MSAPIQSSRPTLTLSRRLDPLVAQRLAKAGVGPAPPAKVDTPQVVPPRHAEAGAPRRQPPAHPRPVQADAATRRWNAKRELQWEAEHPPPTPIQHAPADPETVAWNRLREQQWLSAPARLETLLRELAPTVFSDEPTPLCIGIHQALIELLAGEFDQRTINRFLRGWTRRPAYLQALAAGTVRVDLNGCPTTAPTDADREFAARRLAQLEAAS